LFRVYFRETRNKYDLTYNQANQYYNIKYVSTLKMLGCFNPILGQTWTNSNIGLKMSFKNVTQWLGVSILDPKLG